MRIDRAALSIPLLAVSAMLIAAPAVAAGEDDIPRTASGKPDLTGRYNIASSTPFERPSEFGDKLFLTVEEAEEIMERTRAAVARSYAASDPERSAPPAGGDGSPGAAGAVGGYNSFWTDRGSARFAIDGKFRTSILTDPPNGRMPALSEAGKARRADLHPYAYKNTGNAWWIETGDDPYDGPETLSVLDRCLYLGAAATPARPILYNNLKTITQTEDHVVILIEWMHWAKVVRLNAEHAPPEVRSLGGDSIGWWEGDTLVVETTNFLAQPGVPRDGLKVVERFARQSADGLLYEFTVHDPDYTAPYSGEFIWPQTEEQNYEYACHEGNYAMGNILRGARLLEREYLEQKAQAGSTGSGSGLE
ncbi:MAG: hypothetical protein OXG83_08185 [Acidobacteria bacterium]|nr:hypothetical protein [Acidobacteriota bacterium]